jgi:SAM-dependent methyltransferase
MDVFYLKMVRRLLSNGRINRDSSVLVVCGEQSDAEIFSQAGFRRVTVSNLDVRHEGSWSTGAAWARQDAEALSYADNSFDLVAVHLGLHHCRQPHKALCEMYRVACQGVLVIEPCENLMVKLGRRLGVGQEYEVHAVAAHQLKAGGVNNSSIPNYVYRWTQNELCRTIASFAPEFRPRICCRRNLTVHWDDLRSKKNPARLLLMIALFPFMKGASWIFPWVANNFGVYINKADLAQLNPWIQRAGNDPVLNPAWFKQRMYVRK